MLKTAKFQTTIPLDRTLTLTLPADMPTGEVEILIVVANVEPSLHHAPSATNQVTMAEPSYAHGDYTINTTINPAIVERNADSDGYIHHPDETPRFASDDDDLFYP